MATKKKSASAKKPSKAKWAKNSSDYAKKQAAKVKSKKVKFNAEDAQIVKSKAKRIRDVGQKPPKGYHRTGGMYFAKNENDRPIKSKTTEQQRALYWANKPKFIGVGDRDGWVAQAANQGMYDGATGDVNFRKSASARKLIDADGGTYAPDYKKHAGQKKRAKSRYIMAIGQDGHVR
ncbi:MAG: hypothetical protein ACI4CE_07515 [Methanomethylophilus alvi]